MSRYHDLTRVIPDLHGADHDNEARREEHFELFGHWPPDDPGEQCRHEVHDRIRREMNGATFEIPFDGRTIISSDSELERQRQSRYDMIFQATRQFQKQVEMEDKYENARKAGLILPDRIY
jgi:hypothetical protein